MARRPNVLFLFTDDQRFDTLAALGNPHIHTPNLDALVARGTTFARAHIMGGTSGAVCMPSRAMLHTGRTLFRIEGQGQNIPEDHTTMGEAFRAAGYYAWSCGKWHNGRSVYNRSFDHAEEIYFGGMCDHWNVPAHRYDPAGRYEGRVPRCVDPMTTKEVRWQDADHIQGGYHSTDLFTDVSCRFIEQYDRDQPFFMYVSFMAPHDPRVMPRKYLDLYPVEQIELPPNYAPVHPFDNGELRIRDEMLAGFPRTEAEVREHLRDYYAMVSHLDDRIGDILDALERKGERDNTLIVFAGDNGLAVGQHGLMGKQNLYEHSVRVPLVFAGPGIPENQRSESYCYLIDVFATLCDLTGIDTPASVEGVSLKPAIDDPSESVRDVMLCAYLNIQRSARDDRYKLIEYVVDGRRTTQLFDVREDRWELANLADDPARTDDVERLRGELRRWRDELGDTADDFWAGMGD